MRAQEATGYACDWPQTRGTLKYYNCIPAISFRVRYGEFDYALAPFGISRERLEEPAAAYRARFNIALESRC